MINPILKRRISFTWGCFVACVLFGTVVLEKKPKLWTVYQTDWQTSANRWWGKVVKSKILTLSLNKYNELINTMNEFSKMQLQWITIHLLWFVKPRKKRCNPPHVINVDDTIFFVICVKGERSQNNSRIPSTSILLKQKKPYGSHLKSNRRLLVLLSMVKKLSQWIPNYWR